MKDHGAGRHWPTRRPHAATHDGGVAGASVRSDARLDANTERVIELDVVLDPERQMRSAIDIVAEWAKCGESDAFAILMARSMDRQCDLRDVAEDVVFHGAA